MCLSFVYSMCGDEMGDLNVTQMKHDSGPGKLLFYRYFDQGLHWHPVNLHIDSDGQSKVDNIRMYIDKISKMFHF